MATFHRGNANRIRSDLPFVHTHSLSYTLVHNPHSDPPSFPAILTHTRTYTHFHTPTRIVMVCTNCWTPLFVKCVYGVDADAYHWSEIRSLKLFHPIDIQAIYFRASSCIHAHLMSCKTTKLIISTHIKHVTVEARISFFLRVVG